MTVAAANAVSQAAVVGQGAAQDSALVQGTPSEQSPVQAWQAGAAFVEGQAAARALAALHALAPSSWPQAVVRTAAALVARPVQAHAAACLLAEVSLAAGEQHVLQMAGEEWHQRACKLTLTSCGALAL